MGEVERVMRPSAGAVARWWVLAMLLACGGAARAMSALPDAQAVETLKCLSHTDKRPEWPEHLQRSGSFGFLRVKLNFISAHDAPEIEVLAKIVDDEVLDDVRRYLVSYRLPCMKPGQGPISAVQEFAFDALGTVDGKPLRWVDQEIASVSAKCLVMPDGPVNVNPGRRDSGVVQVLVDLRFDGDGQQAPKAKVFYSDASSNVEKAILAYLSEYRMPCRKTGDKVAEFQQSFRLVLDHSAAVEFAQRQLPLQQFLAMVKNVNRDKVGFDFNTMACPFSLELFYQQPIRANSVSSIGQENFNRAELLAWLSGLHLDLPPRISRGLFGERLVIDVPCSTLSLGKTANN